MSNKMIALAKRLGWRVVPATAGFELYAPEGLPLPLASGDTEAQAWRGLSFDLESLISECKKRGVKDIEIKPRGDNYLVILTNENNRRESGYAEQLIEAFTVAFLLLSVDEWVLNDVFREKCERAGLLRERYDCPPRIRYLKQWSTVSFRIELPVGRRIDSRQAQEYAVNEVRSALPGWVLVAGSITKDDNMYYAIIIVTAPPHFEERLYE